MSLAPSQRTGDLGIAEASYQSDGTSQTKPCVRMWSTSVGELLALTAAESCQGTAREWAAAVGAVIVGDMDNLGGLQGRHGQLACASRRADIDGAL